MWQQVPAFLQGGTRASECLEAFPWHRRLQGSAAACTPFLPPLKLCLLQAPLPAPGLLTGCHLGGGSREQLIFPASFAVKLSLSSSTALLRMFVECGISWLNQRGFLVPGEPHCQPEAPGGAGAIRNPQPTRQQGMEAAAILLLL